MSIHRFSFGESFDEERPEAPPMTEIPKREPEPEMAPAEPEPPPEPTMLVSEAQQQIAQAQEAGRQAGIKEGQAAAMATVEKALADTQRNIEGALTRLFQAHADAENQRNIQTVRLALAVVRKLFPAYAARHGTEEVTEQVGRYLTELAEEPKLLIRVHESKLDVLRGRIDAMVERLGFAGSVTVLADPRCNPLDCIADWGDGGAQRDMAILWAEIDRITDMIFSAAPPPDGAALPPIMTMSPDMPMEVTQ